jgi:hypothetical protein
MSAPAAAQELGRIRLGSAGLTPTIAVTNMGIDGNVYNTPENPQRDFTATFTPNLRTVLTLGPSRLTFNNGFSLVYFKDSDSQRSAGTTNTFQWEVPVNRFRPYAAYTFNHSTARPNIEIDTRAEHTITGVLAGTEVRLAPRVSILVEAQHSLTRFGQDVMFLGTPLRQVLDRSTDSLEGAVRYDLTPLTRLMFSADIQRERFLLTDNRHSKGLTLRPGVEFSPSALIRGSAWLGYRKFNIDNALVNDFSGISTAVDLTSTLREATRLSVRVEREPVYSISEFQPYYVQTGVFASVARRLRPSWEVNVGMGRQWQDYEVATAALPGSIGPAIPLVEMSYQYTYQAGMAFRLSSSITFGVTGEYARRRFGLAPDYNATRLFTNVTYAM